MKSTAPCVHKILEVSSGHITKEDDRLLKKDLSAFAVYNVKGGDVLYGFLIYTGLDDDLEEFLGTKKIGKQEGFSPAFFHLIDLARNAGCKFLQIDCDGVEYDDLPKYDW